MNLQGVGPDRSPVVQALPYAASQASGLGQVVAGGVGVAHPAGDDGGPHVQGSRGGDQGFGRGGGHPVGGRAQ